IWSPGHPPGRPTAATSSRGASAGRHSAGICRGSRRSSGPVSAGPSSVSRAYAATTATAAQTNPGRPSRAALRVRTGAPAGGRTAAGRTPAGPRVALPDNRPDGGRLWTGKWRGGERGDFLLLPLSRLCGRGTCSADPRGEGDFVSRRRVDTQEGGGY